MPDAKPPAMERRGARDTAERTVPPAMSATAAGSRSRLVSLTRLNSTAPATSTRMAPAMAASQEGWASDALPGRPWNSEEVL